MCTSPRATQARPSYDRLEGFLIGGPNVLASLKVSLPAVRILANARPDRTSRPFYDGLAHAPQVFSFHSASLHSILVPLVISRLSRPLRSLRSLIVLAQLTCVPRSPTSANPSSHTPTALTPANTTFFATSTPSPFIPTTNTSLPAILRIASWPNT